MDDKRISVLLIGDDPHDVLLLKDTLAEVPDIQLQVTHADRLTTGFEKLTEGGIDVVLLDLNLPDSQGLDTLTALRAQAPDVPVVVLTGLADEIVAMEAIQQGAQDYLVKGRTDGQTLVRILRYAIERHQLMQSLRASEARLRHLIQKNPDGALVVDQQGLVRYLNPAAEALFGRQAEEMIGEAFGFPAVADETTEVEVQRGAGETVIAEMRVTEAEWEGKPAYLIALRDITRRKRMKAALEQRLAQLQTLYHLGDAVARAGTLDEVYTLALDALQRTLKADRAAVLLFDPDGVIRFKAWRGLSEGYRQATEGHSPWKPDEENPQPLLVPDVAEEPSLAALREVILNEGIRALGFIPLLYQGRLLGKFMIYYDAPHAFQAEEVQWAQTVARHIAFTIERSRAAEALRRRAEELATLHETALDISTLHDLPTLLHAIVERATKLLGGTGGGLYLSDPERREARCVVSYNTPRDYSGTVLKYGEGAAGIVAQTGEPLIIDDYRTWWGRAAAYEEEQPFTAVISAPMIWQGQVTGAIHVLDDVEKRHFTQADLELLTLFAQQAAVAVENARLLAENARRLETLDALYEAAQHLSASLDLQELAATIVRDSVEIFGLKLAWLGRAEPDGRVSVLSHYPLENAYPRKLALRWDEAPEGQGPTGRAIRNGAPVVAEDLTTDPHFAPWRQAIRNEGFYTSAAFPLVSRGHTFGALNLYSEQPGFFTPERVDLLQTYAHQAAAVLEKARLFEKAERNAREVEVAGQVFRSLNATPRVSEAFPPVAAGLRAITHCERASIALLNEDGETFTMYALDQPRPEVPQGVTMNLADTSAADDVLAGRPHLTPDLAAESERPGERALYEAGYRSRLNLPLAVEGKILGALNLTWNEPAGYDLEQLPLLEQIAGAVALALERTRLLQAEQQRRRELEALYQLSGDLVATDDVEPVFDSVVQHVVDAAHVTFCRLVTLEEDESFVCRAAHPVRALDRDLGVGQPEPQALWLLYRRALAQADPWVLHPDHPDLSEEARQALLLDRVQSLCLAPLRVGGEAIGLLVAGEASDSEREPFSAAKRSLLTAIAEQAASSIHRAMLHHQTERRMRWLTALRNIDLAITSSLDPRVILNVLLDQVTTQLNIHAAAVLLLNPHAQILEYATGRGFRTNAIRRSRLRVGECLAGRVALERKVVHIPNLAATDEFLRASLLASEDFVSYYAAPLISKGQMKGVLELFHRTPHVANGEWLEFLETLAGQAAIAIDNAELFDQLHRSNMELTLAYDETLEGWARALELRDYETEGHSRRVTEITVQLARAMGLSEAELVHVRRGALLHDIGKMGIPDNILFKPGKLSDAEWEIMRQHPVYAYEMLASIAYLQPALDIPHYHHERWDGSGYPRGLKGEKIPLAARIFAVVDVWDALRSDRPYRQAWSEEKVRAYLQEQAGKTLDPQVVKMFLDLLAEEENRDHTK